MKFKKIKPGMVIHCPKEEDAEALLEHLDGLGYKWVDEKSLTKTTCWHDTFGEGVYYVLGRGKYVTWENKKSKDGITEFSDLIEPDDSPVNSDTDSPTDSPMAAVEVLEWFGKNSYNGKTMREVFGKDAVINDIVANFGAQAVIDKITAYEAAKKAPKPVEVEWVKLFRIIQIRDDSTKKCVYEEEVNPYVAYGTGEEGNYSFDPKYGVENLLKRYVSEHDGKYIAVIEDVCRVKEGES